MIAWGTVQDERGVSAALRNDDVAIVVRDINRWLDEDYPLTLDALIAQEQTGLLAGRAVAEGWFEQYGHAVNSLTLKAPLERPERIVGIGLNFADHAGDLGETVPEEPATFIKPLNTILGTGSTMSLPTCSHRVTAEAEIALIFSRPARNIEAGNFRSVVWGAVAVLDMTAEDILRKNPRFLTRAKGFDGFFAMSSWLVPWEEADFSHGRHIQTVINGRVAAEGSTNQMAYGYGQVVELVTRDVSVGATAILSTGTPGAGVIAPGDTVQARIEGLPGVMFSVK